MITKEIKNKITVFTTDLYMGGYDCSIEKNNENGSWKVWVDAGSLDLYVEDGKFGFYCKNGEFTDTFDEPRYLQKSKYCTDGVKRSFPVAVLDVKGGVFEMISYPRGLKNKSYYKDTLSPDGVSGHYEAVLLSNNGWKKLYSENLYTGERADFEYFPNGKMKSKKLSSGTASRWDENGNLIYHATKGKEDTKLYLAKQKLAQKQVAKSDELRAKGGVEVDGPYHTTRKRTVVPKKTKLQKAVEVPLAKLKVQKMLRERGK